MQVEWYEAVGGLGLQVAARPDEDADVFAGIIRRKSPRQFVIERWDGATDVCASLDAAKTRLLTMVGLPEAHWEEEQANA
jgi:hypothetical protein